MWIIKEGPAKNKIWYSEQEYEILRQENEEAKEIIAELADKCRSLREKINKLEND